MGWEFLRLEIKTPAEAGVVLGDGLRTFYVHSDMVQSTLIRVVHLPRNANVALKGEGTRYISFCKKP